MNEAQMNCFIDCHAHLSAKEFDEVSFCENIRVLLSAPKYWMVVIFTFQDINVVLSQAKQVSENEELWNNLPKNDRDMTIRKTWK